MQILIVTPMPPQAQPTNAVPLVVQAQCSGLAPRHALTLLTVAGPDPDERAAVGRAHAIGMDIHAIERGELYGLRRWQRRWRLVSSWLAGRYPFRTIWFWDAGVQRILDRLLAETPFDLVMVQDNAMGIYHYRTKAPTILTEMEVRRPRQIDWGIGSRASRVRWALAEADWHRWHRYQRAVWRRFDRVLVFTARDAAGIQAIAPELVERVRINPFGIELPPQADPDREEPGTIVFSGGFSHIP